MMEDWQLRVLKERTDLTEKLVKLVSMLGDERSRSLTMRDEDLAPMMRQAEIMLEYQRVLTLRIRQFQQ